MVDLNNYFFLMCLFSTLKIVCSQDGEDFGFEICFPHKGPFKNHFPPMEEPEDDADLIYSVSTDQRISRPIVAYLCEQNSTEGISPDHPMYSSEKNPKVFTIQSIPVENVSSLARITMCQFAANDLDLWNPHRFDTNGPYFKTYCSNEDSLSSTVTLPPVSIRGNMLIAQGLYHTLKNVEEEFVLRKISFLVFSLLRKNVVIYTNPIKVFSRTAELKWITPKQPFEIPANHYFNISLEIVDQKTNKRIETGLDSTLIVEVTIAYQYKLFFSDRQRQDVLHTTNAVLSGEEVITSFRNYDQVLHKRAQNGSVQFDNVVIEDVNSVIFLNATLILPRVGAALPPIVIDKKCIKTEAENALVNIQFCEAGMCAEMEVEKLYTWSESCVSTAAVKMTGLVVTEQEADGLQILEVRSNEIEYVVPHFQFPGLWVTVVDNAGRRIFSGSDANLVIEINTNQTVTFCKNSKIFKTHRGLARYLGAVCEFIGGDMQFYFTSYVNRTQKNLQSENSKSYSITGVVNIGLFGRFETAGLTDDPDPVLQTFAEFAAQDLNDNPKLFKGQFQYLMDSNITINLKVYDTQQNFSKTLDSFIDMISESEEESREQILGIIGFGSNSITHAMYAILSSYGLPVIAYRENWPQFHREDTYPMLCTICWNEMQTAAHMGHYSIGRQWTSLATIEDTELPVEAGFRLEMLRYKYHIARLVVGNQTDLAEDIKILKSQGIKFIFSTVHAPKQYFLYREAIKNNFTSEYGYQWVTYDMAAKQFDWENKHPLCALQPTCTEAFDGMVLLHTVYNISSYFSPLWYHVNRNFFEMNPQAHKGIPTYRSEIVNGAIALGYDAVLSYAHALNFLIKSNTPTAKETIPNALQGLEFHGLTGRVKYSAKDCKRIGALMAVTTVTKDMKLDDKIVPSVYHKDLIVRLLVMSDIFTSDYVVEKRKRAIAKSALETNFNQKKLILERNVESTNRDIELFKLPYRPLRFPKQPGYSIYFYLSLRGYERQVASNLVSHKDDANLTHLCIRTDITIYSYRCDRGCGGKRLYSWDPKEFKNGRCVSENECECRFFQKGDIYLAAYSGKQCDTPVCDMCLNGHCKNPYTCECQPGWTGYTCGQPVCSGGCVHGECTAPNYCDCPVGYYGTHCEILIGVFAASIAFSSVVLIVILFFCFRWISKKKSKRELLRNVDWLVDWKDVKEITRSQAPTRTSSFVTLSERYLDLKHPSAISDGPRMTYIENTVDWKTTRCFAQKFNRDSLDLNSHELRMEIIELKELKHENLITFIGACFTAPYVSLLVALVPKGSLADILASEAYNLTWAFKFSILVDIAKGMDYLHESTIGSHGRLKSTNCLIDNRWSCKISGFGVQKMRNVVLNTDKSDVQKSMLWTAPELLRLHPTPNEVGSGTKFGDIYSYGIIITEMCTHDRPFYFELQILSLKELFRLLKNLHDPANRGIKKLLETYNYDTSFPIRPSVVISDLPRTYSERKGVQHLVTITCSEEPENRPTFKGVLLELKDFIDIKGGLVQNLIFMLENYTNHLQEILTRKLKQVELEKNKTADLIARLLPTEIIERLKLKHDIRPQLHPSVTILYSDLVGFTNICKGSKPMQVVEMLNDLYTSIDSIIAKFDAYKLETIGDAYCVVSGLPQANTDHYEQLAMLALHILSNVCTYLIPHLPHTKLQIRIGIHTGSCVAGIVGITMPRYCIFGEDVIIAQHMESHGEPNTIQISAKTAALLDEIGTYFLLYRTVLNIKFLGPVSTYWLLGKEGFGQILPLGTPLGSPTSWRSDGSLMSEYTSAAGRSARQSIIWPPLVTGFNANQAKSRRSISFKEDSEAVKRLRQLEELEENDTAVSDKKDEASIHSNVSEENGAQTDQSDAQTDQSDAQTEQSDAQVEQSDAQVEQSDAQVEQSDAQVEQSDAQTEQSLQSQESLDERGDESNRSNSSIEEPEVKKEN